MKSSISRSAAGLFTARKNPDEVVAALDDKTEAVIRELEARHKEARRSLRRRPDHVRGPPRSPEKTYQDLMGWLERLSTGAHVAGAM